MASKDQKRDLPVAKSAEALLQRYFLQVTRGCGDSDCENECCLSAKNFPLDKNSAAAKAVQLLSARTPLCPRLVNGHDVGNAEEETPAKEETSGSNTVEMDVDRSSPASPVLEESSSFTAPKFLTESIINNLISQCEESGDFGSLRKVIGEIFYRAEYVKNSFRLNDGLSIGKDSTAARYGITLDLEQVRSSFYALFNVPNSPFQHMFVGAVKYLMETTELELKCGRSYKEDSEYLNLFVLIMELPILDEPAFIQQAFPAVCRAVANLPVEGQLQLTQFWSKYQPSRLLGMVHAVQQLVTVRLLSSNYGRHGSVQEDSAITAATKLLQILYYAALLGGERDDQPLLDAESEFYAQEDKELDSVLQQAEKSEAKEDPLGKVLNVRAIDIRRPVVSLEDFYNETLSEFIEVDKDFINYKAMDDRFSFMNFPFVLPPAIKIQSMFFDNRLRMHSERRQAFVQSLLQGMPSSPYLRLRVRRSHLLEDSLSMLEVIATESPADLKKQLYVEFDDEQGVDEGGVSKEFYQLITAQLFNPDYGMFTYNSDTQMFWFNSRCLDNNKEYVLIGTLFGLAIYNNIIVDVQFPMVVYRKLLGKLGVWSDLRDVDPVLYKGMKEMLEYDGDDFEDVFGYSFRISSIDCYGERTCHDLKPDGEKIPVTKQNCQEFMDLYADYLLNRSIEQQFRAFRRGFCMVTNESPLSWLFRPDEIEQLVCGSKNYDFVCLEQAADYDNGFSPDHPTIKSFWEVIHEMTEENKRLLLRFTTGSDRVPVGGMSKLKLLIARNGADSDKLPTAHTCFNVLLLPEYSSKEKLKERLYKAITYCQGFGLM